MTVWVVSIGFHFRSKSHPFLPSATDPESHTIIIDLLRVNDQFQFY